MLYLLLTNYSDTYSFLNFFNFLTVRTGLALLLRGNSALIGDNFIKFFNKNYNPIRLDGPEDHLIKKIGTPTMSGLILFGLFAGVFMVRSI